MSNEASKTLKEAPKVGDRVTLPADYRDGGIIWYVKLAGTSGRVTDVNGLAARVEFDNGRIDSGDWRFLAPESTPTAPDQAAPTHIVIEGVRYKLTPEPEAPAEEKKEPKVGELWWDCSNNLFLIARVGTSQAQAVHLWKSLAQRHWGDPVGYKDGAMTGRDVSGWTFAYPSLAAAIKAGEKFE